MIHTTTTRVQLIHMSATVLSTFLFPARFNNYPACLYFILSEIAEITYSNTNKKQTDSTIQQLPK